MMLGNALEHISQVGFGIDVIELGGADELSRSISLSLAVPMSEYIAAARSPPQSKPAKR